MEKIKKLVINIHENDNYDTYINNYFLAVDDSLLKLTYINFIDDIKKILKFINIIYTFMNIVNTDISPLLKKKYKAFAYKLKLSKTNIQNIEQVLNNYNIDNFEQESVNFNNTSIISTYPKYKQYLSENIKLYKSYCELILIYLFISEISKQPGYVPNILIDKLCNKYIVSCKNEIYKYQIYVERDYTTIIPHSKSLISHAIENNIHYDELYTHISSANSKKYKSIINLKKIETYTEENYIKKINLCKFNIKYIKDNKLTKTFGLCNIDLYNLLNNSELEICYTNKSFYYLKNDIRIKLRQADESIKNKYPYFVKLQLLSNVFFTVNNIITNNIDYFVKGYFIEFNNIDKIYFSRNAIINIDYTPDEYINLDNTIKSCKYKYILVYCSQLSFKIDYETQIKDNFKGGHKVSLIIDTKNNNIIFFDPYGIDEYNIYNDTNINIPLIYTLLAIELSKNLETLNNYNFLYTNKNVPVQNSEHRGYLMDKIYNYNFKQIFSPEKKKLRDWAGGYCGLWNYLYIFLLVINPHLDLQDIYIFFDKITDIKYNPMFVKLLIRNFAYYIEQALVTPNYVIPLTQLDMKQFDDMKLKEVKFDNNNQPVKLRLMHSNNYYQKEETPEKEGEPIEKEEFEIDKFIEEHTSLKKIFTSSKVRSEIIAIVKDYSKYLFAKGGLALYAPDKVNFIKV